MLLGAEIVGGILGVGAVGAGIAYLAGAFGGGDKKPQQPVAPKPEPIKVEPLHTDGGNLVAQAEETSWQQVRGTSWRQVEGTS